MGRASSPDGIFIFAIFQLAVKDRSGAESLWSHSLPLLRSTKHGFFRSAWWGTNLLLVIATLCLIYSAGWEHSVRQYLRGFSDAVVPDMATAEQKVEAILAWMRSGPPQPMAAHPEELSKRDPETTLNYQQLLSACGTATNAFLNLARSSGLSVRRLLLLTPQHNTKHVVAEVLIDGSWVIVDPTYRTIMRDENGLYLTRRDLQDPTVFAQAAKTVPNYPTEYNYDNFAHVRLARLPMQGLGLRQVLNRFFPAWDEAMDWSLILERESFFALVASFIATLLFLSLRISLAWYADRHLKITRFHLREHLWRAVWAFFTTPEIKPSSSPFLPTSEIKQ